MKKCCRTRWRSNPLLSTAMCYRGNKSKIFYFILHMKSEMNAFHANNCNIIDNHAFHILPSLVVSLELQTEYFLLSAEENGKIKIQIADYIYIIYNNNNNSNNKNTPHRLYENIVGAQSKNLVI